MPETHIHPPGLLPVLGYFHGNPVSSYGVCVALACLVGLLVYAWEARKYPKLGEHACYIGLAALLGGTLGAKLPVWVTHYRQIIAALPDLAPLASGRTIVGGLIGGTLAVIAVRKWLGVTMKTGNLFAPAIALALAIGRMGCLLGGCCYGIPAQLPWSINLGDGVWRHPTQIYEALFALALFVYLQLAKRTVTAEGALFGRFMLAYFTFRFGIEFLRVEPRPYLGLTLAQVVSLGVIAYYLFTGRKHAMPEPKVPAST